MNFFLTSIPNVFNKFDFNILDFLYYYLIFYLHFIECKYIEIKLFFNMRKLFQTKSKESGWPFQNDVMFLPTDSNINVKSLQYQTIINSPAGKFVGRIHATFIGPASELLRMAILR